MRLAGSGSLCAGLLAAQRAEPKRKAILNPLQTHEDRPVRRVQRRRDLLWRVGPWATVVYNV